MRVVALVSGGKDSCYSMQLCKQHGHDVVALANLLPEESAPDELDSFCFQTVGHQLIGAYAACMGIPLFRKRISGTSSVQDLGYTPTEGDEVEDLYQLLAYVKENVPGIQAVASGAIASDYQRLRVENVCSRLNLVSLAYLWHQPQRLLLRGMVESGVEAILVKVACLGLHPRKHLGRTIAAMEPALLSLADAYGCNVCGEGGEYETLTLDCPVFTRGSIVLDEFEIVHGTSDVGHLVPKSFHIVTKPCWEGCELPADVRIVPGDYVAAPRYSRCSASQLPPLAPPPLPPAVDGAAAPSAANAIAAAAGGPAAAAAVDPLLLLQPVAPSSFHVHVSMCSGPDYVQLVCRAVRPKSALPSDLTECDTTAALHALLTAAEQELATQHMDLHHCLFVHLFLANMGHFQAANGVYCKHFPSRDPPSRACVQVCLPQHCPVMCEFLLARGAAPPAIAAANTAATGTLRSSPLPGGGGGGVGVGPPPPPSPVSVSRHTRRVLHVQSISSWAPSCIGPYSQATSYRGLVYLAGVIPLDPPVMTVVPGDITAQVLRAMLSCEAVAVAQRSTVVGAALGLTVYLAAAVGGGGGGGGGGVTAAAERSGASFSSGGGAELRALTRAAVEAILEHGLPCYPHAQHRQGNGSGGSFGPPGGSVCLAGGGSSFRYQRSATCDSSGGLATPRSAHGAWLNAAAGFGGGRISAPSSRRVVLLGADGLDEEEEEEEAERAAAAAAAGGGGGGVWSGGRMAIGSPAFAAAAPATVLDPYLQPPEVRVPLRPNVLYVTVPSLPRGSLVEIQPVCLDVEALAVIRKLTGHDSFVKRRNNSHQDTTSLHQSAHSHSHHNQSSNTNANHHQHNHHHNQSPALAQPSSMPQQPNLSLAAAAGPVAGTLSGPTVYCSPTGGAFGATTSWSELPPTPRASLESLSAPYGNSGGGGSDGDGGSQNNSLQSHHHHHHHHHHGSGSSPVQWQVSNDLLASPLPSHVLSAAGFMSPDAGGSLAGTPSGGPSYMSRQRSSGLGLIANGGGAAAAAAAAAGLSGLCLGGSSSGIFHRCLSPSPQPPSQLQLPLQLGSSSQLQLMHVPQPQPVAVGSQLPGLLTPPQPPLSAQSSGHQLLSPTIQHLLQLQSSSQHLLQPLQQPMADPLLPQQHHSLARSAPGPSGSGRRHRVSSSNGGATTKETPTAPSASGLAPRSSYSGSSGSGSSTGPLAHRSSLDGNILSFEVSSGRGGPPVLLSQQPYSVPHSTNAASLADAVAAPAVSAGALSSSGGTGGSGLSPPIARARPAAIAVPQPCVGGAPIHRSPFECPTSASTTAAALLAAGGASPLLCAAAAAAMPAPAPQHVPTPLMVPQSSSGSLGSDASLTPKQAAAAATALASAGAPPASELRAASGVGGGAANAKQGQAASAAPAASNSSSDVMVTTVCCYGQVLRSLFHLPPAVFAPGVTTAQLTRRFRRAAASVLAAHGMDMSCLIWVRVWYEKGSVELTDDEYGTGAGAAGASAAAAAGPHAGTSGPVIASGGMFGGGGMGASGPRVLHALDDDVDNDGIRGGGSTARRSRDLRRVSGSGDSGSSGGGGVAATTAAAAVARINGGDCASPRSSATARVIAVSEAATGGGGGSGGSGGGSPRGCPGSPASAMCTRSPSHPRRLSGLQFDTSQVADDKQGNQHHQHHHHQHHLQSNHGHAAHQSHHTHHHQQQQQHQHQHHPQHGLKDMSASGQHHQQHFHVSWVPVQRVATNASPQPARCVAVLELLAALPTP